MLQNQLDGLPGHEWEIAHTANEIIPYLEMCQREGVSLQRGMNFGIGGTHSVILTSLRPNAPYDNRLEDEGTVLIYEGHDEPRSQRVPNPNAVDQPNQTPKGSRTQNGKFFTAAKSALAGNRLPERVRVDEKLRQGIWSYNGVFHLVDSWTETSGGREVFKFRLIAVEGGEDFDLPAERDIQRRRIIPKAVKLAVWQRDSGKCVICGEETELHFDHILPYSKGGTSIVAENVQLLCARHNLQKSDRIE